MTTYEQHAIETAKVISQDITRQHGTDVPEAMKFLWAMQYPQWAWVVEDLGLSRARLALLGGRA